MCPAKSTPRTPEELRQVTEQNGTQSPLLSLPGELRNTIYEYVLAGHTWDIGWDGKAQAPVKHVWGLLGTCRQIHVEARTYPWSGSTFCVRNRHQMSKLVSGIPRECRAAITSVKLDLFSRWSDNCPWVCMGKIRHSIWYLSSPQRFRLTVESNEAETRSIFRTSDL